MKLVLKNKQEIQIESMNNAHSLGGFKNKNGNALDYDSIINLYVGQNESFTSVKAKVSEEGNIGFILKRGNEKRDFEGWKIDVITEELSDTSKTIVIKLAKI